jgi:glycosyltransferase involved in cell wall biosynthesis
MRIGVDASRTTARWRTGTEGYSLHLIRELVRLGVDHQFRLYFNQAPPSGLFAAEGEQRIIPFPRLWTHARLSWEMLRQPPDVLFVPAHVLPLVHPRRSVATIHDLGYYYYPAAHTRFQNLYLRWSTRYNARNALRLVVDSEATRRDLIRLCGVPPAKIVVIYPGRDESLVPVTDPALLAGVRARYGLAERYLLYVGTLHPRKNLARLVEAFAAAAREMEPAPQLVLAGKKGWLYDDLFARVRRLGLEERVLFPGYVPPEELPALLSGATAFLFPSLYEGFGFPVLEAMACGTPVICSRAASLPEVAGEAALLVDPLDTAGLAEAIRQVVADEDLRRRLVERGHQQVTRFSWSRCARQVLDVLEEVAGEAA